MTEPAGTEKRWRARRVRRRAAGLAALLAALAASPLWSGTPVERGDVLHVEVANTPEITRDAKVDADGRVRLPLLGGVPVAGSDVDEIQRRIETALVEREIILDPVVLVEVASYRPVYVGGTVKSSGPVTFLPGLTVRHAVIAAGGLQADKLERAAGVGEVLELLARQRAVEAELAQTDSAIARLRAQLDDTDKVGDDTPAPGAEDFAAVDRNLLQDYRHREAENDAYTETAVDLVELELDVLNRQAAHQEEEHRLQSEEVDNTRTLVEKGLVPAPRLKELQREQSRLARDLLENNAFAARARQSMEQLRHQSDAEKTATKIDLRKTYRDALQQRATMETNLEVIRAHLLAAGREQGTDGRIVEMIPEIVIHRQIDGKQTQLPAELDTEILPGDVVEVSLRDAPRG